MNDAATQATTNDDDEIVTLEKVRAAVQTQTRRIKNLARDDGSIDSRTVLHEIHGTVMLIIADIVDLIDRLEGHANWASEEITTLRGDSPDASQLDTPDADRLQAFLERALDLEMLPEEVRAEAIALRELVDDLRLTDEGAAGDDDEDNDEGDNAAPTNGGTS